MKCKYSYVFILDKMLTQETITIDVNNVISFVVNRIESKPNITSHSFWIGYITSL